MKKNADLCFSLFCFSDDTALTAERFISLIDSKVEVPTEFSKKQSYDWFIQYVQSASAEQLQCLLKFATSFKTIPPYGMEHKITIKYLPDDDTASLPKSLACLAILSLPTVHSSHKKLNESIDVALKVESE
ncbi:G2 M phase-specific E3 ubiquitin- ligase-like isoform X4, partial [Paramuricea clavata]